jgi:hypothetical protein
MHNENGDFHLPKGSLYTPFPVPAYQVLGRAKQHNAQKVLLALVSHMGKNDNAVFPSYVTIMKSAGIGKNSVSAGLKVLHDYGFIKSFSIKMGVRSRNKYYLQYACWDSGRMNKLAKPYQDVIARCSACGGGLNRGDFDFSPLGKVHWGCGGIVEYLNSYTAGRNQDPLGNY